METQGPPADEAMYTSEHDYDSTSFSSPDPLATQSSPLTRSYSADRSPSALYRRRDSSPSRLQTQRSVSGLPQTSRIPQRNIKDLVNRFNQAAGHGERPLMPPTLKDRYKKTEEQRVARLMKPRSPVKDRHNSRPQLLRDYASQMSNRSQYHDPLHHTASEGNLRNAHDLHGSRAFDTNAHVSDWSQSVPLEDIEGSKSSVYPDTQASESEDTYDHNASTDEQMSDHQDLDDSDSHDRMILQAALRTNSTLPSSGPGSDTLRTARPSRLTHPNAQSSPQQRRPIGSPGLKRSERVSPSPDKPSRLPLFRPRQPPPGSRVRDMDQYGNYQDMSPNATRRRQHRKLPDLVRVDFAERRARIERAISQNLGDTSQPAPRPSKSRTSSGRHARGSANADAHSLEHISEKASSSVYSNQESSQGHSTEFEEDSGNDTDQRPMYMESDSDSIQITPIEYSRQDRGLYKGSTLLSTTSSTADAHESHEASRRNVDRAMMNPEKDRRLNLDTTRLDPNGDDALYLPRTPVKVASESGTADRSDETPRPTDSSMQDTPQAVPINDTPETFMQQAIRQYELTGHINPDLFRELERLGLTHDDGPGTSGSDVATIRVLLDRMSYHQASQQSANTLVQSNTALHEPVTNGPTPNTSDAQPADNVTYSDPRSSFAEWHSDRPSTNTSYESGQNPDFVSSEEHMKNWPLDGVKASDPETQSSDEADIGTERDTPRLDAQAGTPSMAYSTPQRPYDSIHSYSLPEIVTVTPFNPALGLGLDMGEPPLWRPTSVPALSPTNRPTTHRTPSSLAIQTAADSDEEPRRSSEPTSPKSQFLPFNAAVNDGFLQAPPANRRSDTGQTIEQPLASASQMSLAASSTDYSLVTTPLDDSSAPTEVQRRISRRRNIVKELIDTEYSYHQDIKVIEDIYKATCDSVLTADDKKILFGNADQIEGLSLEFYDSLRQSVEPFYVISKSSRWHSKRSGQATDPEKESPEVTEVISEETDRQTAVGAVFVSFMPRLERVYATYVKNHDAANKRLATLQAEQKVAAWLKACHSNANDITSAWNLDSLLVKPVQRILKYPLLLQQLLASTPNDYPDYEALRTAAVESTNISQRINEAKKRADLVESIAIRNKRKDSEIRAGLAKAFGIRTEKVKERIGLKNEYQDPVFEELSMRFGGHFVRLQVVLRDVQAALTEFDKTNGQLSRLALALDNYMSSGANLYPEMEIRWRDFIAAVKELSATKLADYKDQVQKRVIAPISAAIKLHEGPQSVIAKRKKRVVDYVRRRQMEKQNQKPDKKTLEGSELYMALNEQLKIDLPKLYELTARLVQRCLACYHQIHQNWLQAYETKLKPIVDQIPDSFDQVAIEHEEIYPIMQDQLHCLGVVNGTLLANAAQFLSPQISLTDDGRNSWARSSHSQSIGSEFSGANHPYETSRGYSVASLGQYSPGSPGFRTRSASNLSGPRSRAPSGSGYPAPRLPAQAPTAGFAASRAQPRPSDIKPAGPERLYSAPPSSHGYTYSRSSAELRPSPRIPADAPLSPLSREQSRASIAYPPVESPRPPAAQQYAHPDAKPAFVVVSLYAFNIDKARREAGFPYLTYGRGEVFDVLRQEGELWLAWNQDDPARELGWIWEQHFVVLGEES